MKIKGVDVHVAGPLYAFCAGVMLPVLAWLSRHNEEAMLSLPDALSILWSLDLVRFVLAAYCMAMAFDYWKPAQRLLYAHDGWERTGLPLTWPAAKRCRVKLGVCCSMMLLFYAAAFAALPGPVFTSENWLDIAKSALAFAMLATAVFPIGIATRLGMAGWQAHKQSEEVGIGA